MHDRYRIEDTLKTIARVMKFSAEYDTECNKKYFEEKCLEDMMKAVKVDCTQRSITAVDQRRLDSEVEKLRIATLRIRTDRSLSPPLRVLEARIVFNPQSGCVDHKLRFGY